MGCSAAPVAIAAGRSGGFTLISLALGGCLEKLEVVTRCTGLCPAPSLRSAQLSLQTQFIFLYFRFLATFKVMFCFLIPSLSLS